MLETMFTVTDLSPAFIIEFMQVILVVNIAFMFIDLLIQLKSEVAINHDPNLYIHFYFFNCIFSIYSLCIFSSGWCY